MTLVDLLNIVPEAYDSLPCSAYECDICIALGKEKFEIINHVELRHSDDKKHAIFVFYHDQE